MLNKYLAWAQFQPTVYSVATIDASSEFVLEYNFSSSLVNIGGVTESDGALLINGVEPGDVLVVMRSTTGKQNDFQVVYSEKLGVNIQQPGLRIACESNWCVSDWYGLTIFNPAHHWAVSSDFGKLKLTFLLFQRR